VSLKQSTDVDFEQVSNKNKELKSFADETSKINKELIEENKSLRDWANYKDVENKGLINQLEELQSVETNLQELMSKMELKDSEITSSNTSLTTKVSTQQKVITDMGKTLEDMKKELVYLVRLNNEYKKELARPTYTSMAAIASQEGFVMPNGKENTRTHNLGNYKPTLIKFKKKEAANGG
jgi:chromosome segregation ATPase